LGKKWNNKRARGEGHGTWEEVIQKMGTEKRGSMVEKAQQNNLVGGHRVKKPNDYYHHEAALEK